MKRPDLLKHKDAFINSMEVLIERYQRAMARGISKSDLESEDGEECLLCNPIGLRETRQTWYQGIGDSGCKLLGCPWMVMEDLACFPRVRPRSEVTYSSTDPEVQQARINQLKEWIEAYKNFEEVK